jgi:hypothetical protein
LLLLLDFFAPLADERVLLALLALAFSLWRCAACALLAFLVPVLAAPRLPLLRLESSSDLGDFMGYCSWKIEGLAVGPAMRWILNVDKFRHTGRATCRFAQALRVGIALFGSRTSACCRLRIA